MPGVKLPKPKMYSMTPKEMKELQKYIDTNLATGFIQPAKSRVLLQKNADGTLQPCAYTSKKLSETERRWAVWEKEAYAI